MKHILVLFCFVYASCLDTGYGRTGNQSSLTTPLEQSALTTLEMSKKMIEFGNVGADTILTARFDFKNSGDHNLVISELRPDCTCTEHFLSKDTIFPNDRAYIILKVATKNKYGDTNVYAVLKANTTSNLYMLGIHANVLSQ